MEVIEGVEYVERRQVMFATRDERKKVELEESLENLSRYLDGMFRVPGTGWRFGLDALIGLIPNAGDSLTALMSFYILVAGARYGVPKITLLRMAFNIGLDYVVGMIPFIGDAFDFFWKSNKRNMDLIRERATGHNVGTGGDYLFVFGIIFLLIGLLIGSILVSLYLIALVVSTLWGVAGI
jgi:hypothetical protein